MDSESSHFRFALYRSVVMHGLADAAIVFFLCCVAFAACHALIDRVWGMRPAFFLASYILNIVLPLAAGLRAGRVTARARIAAHRRASGQCLYCGYDLRASPDHCPECGRSVRAARYGGRH